MDEFSMATPRPASATPHRANLWSGSGLGTNRKAAAVDIRWPGGGTQRLADVKADASSWYAQFLYGLRHCFENDLQLALRPLEKAHRLNPRDPRAALYLRLAYESLGQTAEALALYQEARRLQEASGQRHTDTLLVGSRLLLLLGRVDECEDRVRAALRSEPASQDAHFEFGRVLLTEGYARRAAEEAESALRLAGGSATDSQIHYLLVRAYRDGGREDLASQHAEALRVIPPAIPR